MCVFYLQRVVQDSVTGVVVGDLPPVTVFHVLITGAMANVLGNVTLPVASMRMQLRSTAFRAVNNVLTLARVQ